MQIKYIHHFLSIYILNTHGTINHNQVEEVIKKITQTL